MDSIYSVQGSLWDIVKKNYYDDLQSRSAFLATYANLYVLRLLQTCQTVSQ